jgi:hypothetical protein
VEKTLVIDNQTDHDLLVRIDEQVKQMRIGFDLERSANIARAIKLDSEFDTYKRDTAERIKGAENDIESLRMSRAQFYAISGTIAALISILIKVFWK